MSLAKYVPLLGAAGLLEMHPHYKRGWLRFNFVCYVLAGIFQHF